MCVIHVCAHVRCDGEEDELEDFQISWPHCLWLGGRTHQQRPIYPSRNRWVAWIFRTRGALRYHELTVYKFVAACHTECIKHFNRDLYTPHWMSHLNITMSHLNITTRGVLKISRTHCLWLGGRMSHAVHQTNQKRPVYKIRSERVTTVSRTRCVTGLQRVL